jgi:hypothetical protein
MIEMKIKIKIKYSYKLLLLILGVAFIAFGFLGDDKNGVKAPRPIYKLTNTQESGKQGDAYALNINNIWMPLNRKGIIADVNVLPNGSLGQYAGGGFLFSSGFFLSGYSNGTLFANACASASLTEDYLQGVVGGENDPNAVLYVVNAQDEPFGKSWQDWKDAVALGADFYDGDGDSVYNPVDGGIIGVWEPNEDMPDLIGDETVWCVFHDGLPVAQRNWNQGIEVGLEIRQTVFAFASAGAIGNLIFVRYRIKYVGTDTNDPEELTDVYFGAWADPDLGDATDDVIGVDTLRNSGYTYQDVPDAQYGSQVPCFMIDFFSGPRAYIPGVTFNDNNGDGEWTPEIEPFDTAIDSAFSVRGQIKDIQAFPGAMNLPISSFVMYINGDADLRDPDNIEEARNYCLGLNRIGEAPDPCTFAYGTVTPVSDCGLVDPRFWFSGDPVTGLGWICNQNRDMRQMTNTGPFTLKKGEENEIVLAYVVGRGADPLDGITKARAIDDGAQIIFDLNFLAPSPPPAPEVTLSSSDDFIDISWETPDQVIYKNKQPAWDMRFEGYQVWAFKTNIAEDIVSGQVNSALIGSYDLGNYIENIYKENAETGGLELLYPLSPLENQLDSNVFRDPTTGRIRVRIFDDPFTNTNVVKGRPYYFAVTSYALNYDALFPKNGPAGDSGDYYLSAEAFAQEAENIRTINSIVVGEDSYNPPVVVQPATRVSGNSTGNVGYDVINIDELTSSQYEVTFFKDTESALYKMFWKITNTTTDSVLIERSDVYSYGQTSVSDTIREGFIPRVEDITATIGTAEYQPSSAVWYDDFSRTGNGTGTFYVGNDLTENAINVGRPPLFPGQKCNQISADKMRRVELRFGSPGKAYRYINGYKGSALQSENTFAFASAIGPTDTVSVGTFVRGPVGNWDLENDRANGWVDVPFTAWLIDPGFSNDEIQLAVGFLERRKRGPNFNNGNPDGIWDPTDSLRASGEYIFIFNSPYDPNGAQIEFTGGDFSTPGGPVTVWSDLLKASPLAGDIPPDATGVTEEQRLIFDSPYFNSMYTVGLQKQNVNSFYTAGDKLIIPLSVYPYTEEDVYQFTLTADKTISEEDEKALWEKVNVYPNPLFGYNTLSNYYSNTPDEPFVTFTNLPEQVTIKIYSLSGTLLRTLTTDDKDSPTSPFLRWDLENESELRIASGMYLGIVSSPIYGDKVLKFAIIMPQKQIQRF